MNARFDPQDPDFQRDPYPHYHAQRNQTPIHHRTVNDVFDVWWLTRYDDCVEVLKDPRFSASKVPPFMMEEIQKVDPESAAHHRPDDARRDVGARSSRSTPVCAIW